MDSMSELCLSGRASAGAIASLGSATVWFLLGPEEIQQARNAVCIKYHTSSSRRFLTIHVCGRFAFPLVPIQTQGDSTLGLPSGRAGAFCGGGMSDVQEQAFLVRLPDLSLPVLPSNMSHRLV